jgi:large subunit ribosomal protein L3
MPTRKSPRKGSLQFWPRKRASKFLPSSNWDAIKSGKNLKGFIGYKVGMTSISAKDNTPHSMTKGKKISVPVTIIECPLMKILSVRLYKNGIVAKDILNKSLPKELKSKIKIPKKTLENLEKLKPEDYDDLRLICYSNIKKTDLKNVPDLTEVGLSGSFEEKLNFVKENLNKDISVLDVFEKGQLVDFRGLTKGHGLSGPVKRFGIKLKQAKSEKGRRRPGSLAPWHPARVTFRAPQAGQLGMFTRIVYNNKIIGIEKSSENSELNHMKNYGNIKTDYLIVRGSVQGPAKRQILITAPLRETKKQKKKEFEFLEIVK